MEILKVENLKKNYGKGEKGWCFRKYKFQLIKVNL